jgi:Carboxypeptidase regulatory-like domain
MKRKRSGRAVPRGLLELRSAATARRLAVGDLVRAAATLGAAAALLVPMGLAAKAKAPPTKTVQGAVLDSANKPIAGAAVELTDETTNKKYGIYSEAGGRYRFTGLTPSDDFSVKAIYQGRKSEVRHASSLDDRDIVVLNLTIPAPSSQ